MWDIDEYPDSYCQDCCRDFTTEEFVEHDCEYLEGEDDE